MINRMRLLNWLVGVFLILGVTIYAVNMYSSYVEKPWLSYRNLPFPMTEQAYPGGKIEFVVVRCNSSSEVKQIVSTRALVPEDITMMSIVFDFVFVNVAPGCSPAVTLSTNVPESTPPGFYRYVGKSKIKGLISEHEVDWNTTLLEVVKKPNQ